MGGDSGEVGEAGAAPHLGYPLRRGRRARKVAGVPMHHRL